MQGNLTPGVAGKALQLTAVLIDFIVPSTIEEQAVSSVIGFGTSIIGRSAVLFGQKSVSKFFSKKGTFAGESVKSLAEKIKAGIISVDDVPVEYVVIKGQKVAVNNRSLTAITLAGKNPTKLINKTSNKKILKKVQERLKEMDNQPSQTVNIRNEEKTKVTILDNIEDQN